MRYGVIGAGRQGTAAAYDMARWGDANQIVLADRELDAATKAARRINTLVGNEMATATRIDVADRENLVALLHPLDAVLCATPYALIPACTAAAIEAHTGMVDLGGHTPTVLGQWQLDPRAKDAGVAIVPDCGMGPGLNNTLALAAVETLEAMGAVPKEARVWDGGLQQHPSGPFGYHLLFNIEGLTNEYDGMALVLRDGEVREIETLTELETLEFDELGTLEAFVTSGGTSTVPYSYEGTLDVYENKTLRYPGHLAAFQAFRDLGLFGREGLNVGEATVVPRDVYHQLLSPRLQGGDPRDVCVMRAEASGERDGVAVRAGFEVIDRYDEETGFLAMERLTGWHAAVITEMIARGEICPGVHPLERAVSQRHVLNALKSRGIHIVAT